MRCLSLSDGADGAVGACFSFRPLDHQQGLLHCLDHGIAVVRSSFEFEALSPIPSAQPGQLPAPSIYPTEALVLQYLVLAIKAPYRHIALQQVEQFRKEPIKLFFLILIIEQRQHVRYDDNESTT